MAGPSWGPLARIVAPTYFVQKSGTLCALSSNGAAELSRQDVLTCLVFYSIPFGTGGIPLSLSHMMWIGLSNPGSRV